MKKDIIQKEGLGTVETKYATFAEPPHEMVLESGAKLGPITLAYETYGELNKDKSNVVLIVHALSGDAHAAGWHDGDKHPGWWDNMIGPGKAFDTEKYFIICSNVIGGCKGSTGPASINPKTGKPYGLSFPLITIRDMVQAQKLLLDQMGIKKILAVAGGSMGGQQVLKWAIDYPEMVRSAIPIATTTRHTAQQIALNEVGRQAIMADPDWQGGDYYGKTIPARGLALARMIGHITYMSDKSMAEKFGRKLISKEKGGFDFSQDFEVENYLKYRGDSFVQRFDANSYLYITKALDYFDLAEDGKLTDALRKAKAKFLIIAFTSDWLYPTYQSKEIVKALKANDIDVSFCEVSSDYGHDAFLVEVEGQSRLIKHFLARVQKEIKA
ncbi:MAG TPA: homoserine O-acetyltransferase [Candidatus Omnitrophota bacterium]|nr:homoserine O-acetyltransferase [Candidatus Omnitrophota bacterium]HPD85383.1 homoserine O-acetyltransferase [Candidatus Omnitrophota bacterium]HRZ04116.1 homoserine O-acetyltransferase [Candidatus Omnitrophota bacterium]